MSLTDAPNFIVDYKAANLKAEKAAVQDAYAKKLKPDRARSVLVGAG
jgi:hypothetical protein